MIEARAIHLREMQDRQVYTPEPRRSLEPKKKKGRYVLAVFLVAISSMISLYQFARLTETQFRIERITSDLNGIYAQNERLEVEVAKLKSVARIEEIAKDDLSMIEPESHQIIYINKY